MQSVQISAVNLTVQCTVTSMDKVTYVREDSFLKKVSGPQVLKLT